MSTTRQQAIVVAVDNTTHTVTLNIGGSAVNVPNVRYFSWYTPTVNDTVFLDEQDGDLIVHGKLA